jgi:hypothetical protein
MSLSATPESIPDSNDLVSAKYACRAIDRVRATFYRLYHKQLIPHPVVTKPIMLWSKRQLRLSRTGEIQKHPETGIWFERDPDTYEWKPLPNQYVNSLPSNAVTSSGRASYEWN